VGSPGWRFALCFRDWLRDDAEARADYLAEKRRVAKLHGVDKSTAGYAADKEGWFAGYAAPRMDAWARRTGWQPPSYTAPAPEQGPEQGRERGPEAVPTAAPEPGPRGTGPGTAQS
jgi:dephospho-CoA kinase